MLGATSAALPRAAASRVLAVMELHREPKPISMDKNSVVLVGLSEGGDYRPIDHVAASRLSRALTALHELTRRSGLSHLSDARAAATSTSAVRRRPMCPVVQAESTRW